MRLACSLLLFLLPIFAARADDGTSFFTNPSYIAVNNDHAIIENQVPYGNREQDVYLLAIPSLQNTPSVEVQELMLRSISSTETVTLKAEGDAEDMHLLGEFRNHVSVIPFGKFRRLAAARLRVERKRTFHFNNSQHEVAGYRLRVNYAPAASTSEVLDSALQEGPYRTLLNAVLANPENIERFALPDAPSPHPGPTEWQPRPELSPDFPWLAFGISEDGLYSIDGRWLSEAGVDAANVRPEELTLHSRGEPVPMELVGPAGVGFHGGQRLIFYGEDSSSRETAERRYHLGRTLEPAPRFASGESAPPNAPILNHYVRERVIREENVFQTRFGLFLSIRAMQWVWEELKSGTTWQTAFDLPGFAGTAADGDETTASLTLYFQDQARTPKSTLDVTLGRETIASVEIDGRTSTIPLSIPVSLLRERNNRLALNLSPAENGTPISGVFVESINISYRGLIDNSEGRHELVASPHEPFVPGEYRLLANRFRAARLIAVDLTEPAQPRRLAVSSSGGNVFVNAHLQENSRILLIEDGTLPRAPAGGRMDWVDWVSRDHSAEVLIIHHPIFREAAELLAENIEESGQESSLATTQSIYSAFSHGELSSDAIRNFLAYSVNEWTGRRPHSVILIGDANGDGRGIARNDVPNFLPAPLAGANGAKEENFFAADSVYSWLSGDDEMTDIVVGRISSSTAGEALATVRNIIAYRSQQDREHEWGNRLMAVTDTGNFSMPMNSAIAAALAPQYDVTRVYADDFPWEDNYYLPPHLLGRAQDAKVSPLTTSAIEEAFNNGVAVAAFLGHGAPNLWSNQRFWFGGGTPNSDILRLQNSGRLAYAASFTCNNAVIDYPLKPWNVCIAEDFMRHEGKGAVSTFMPSGPGYVSNHAFLADGFFRGWSKSGVREHGLIAELSRLNQQVRNRIDEHSRMFIFLGDPTLRLPPVSQPPIRRELNSPAPVSIVTIHDVTTTNTATQRAFNVVLGNDARVDQSAALTVRAVSAAGELVETSELSSISLPSLHQEPIFVDLELERAGAYAVSFEAASENTASPQIRVFAVSEPGGLIEPLESTLTVNRASSRNNYPRVELHVANTGTEVQGGLAKITILSPSGKEIVGERRFASIEPGDSLQLHQEIDFRGEMTEPLNVQVALFEAQEGAPAYAQFEHRIEPAELPDLAIVPGSLRVVPEEPTDGFTIFIEGIVRNEGGSDGLLNRASPETQIGLYAGDGSDTSAPLRDMTTKTVPVLEPLRAGEERPFRLRWDPHDNAGENQVSVVIDGDNMLLEPDKSNNRASITFNVRTKWKLVPGELTMEQGSVPGSAVFVAQVENQGETDAGPVTVNFHRSLKQNNETKVGEVLLEAVPAGEKTSVRFEWQPTEQERAKISDAFEPSFTLALKGSQQRVSSVAGQP